jgi:hypothetical protein
MNINDLQRQFRCVCEFWAPMRAGAGGLGFGRSGKKENDRFVNASTKENQ